VRKDDWKDRRREPRKSWRARPTILFGLAVVAAAAFGVALACRSEKPASLAKARIETGGKLSMAVLAPVFGDAKDVRSGLSDFTQSDREIILSYHLYLADPTDADREIARELAPKIRRLYGRFPGVDRASFEISLPDPASPDAWKPYVAFALTRKVVKELGWSDLFDTDLLSAALDVKRTS